MKKPLTLLLAAVLCTSICVAAVSTTTQSNAKKQERVEKRAQKQQQQIDLLMTALAKQTFMFVPTNYMLPYQTPVMLTAGRQYFLDFYPQDMDIYLPFEMNQNPEFIFETSLQPYQNYMVKKSNDPKTPNTYIVTANLRNIANFGTQVNPQNQDFNLGLHMTVDLATGLSFLTLTPDFSAPVSYQGYIHN